MKTLALLVTLVLSLSAVACVAEVQLVGKVHRVGWLRHTIPPPEMREALLHGLLEMGYVEGQNLVMEVRYGDGKAARLPALAAELVQFPDEVLVSSGSEATGVAKVATSTIPIVFANTSDPVPLGFITSWARPGGRSMTRGLWARITNYGPGDWGCSS